MKLRTAVLVAGLLILAVSVGFSLGASSTASDLQIESRYSFVVNLSPTADGRYLVDTSVHDPESQAVVANPVLTTLNGEPVVVKAVDPGSDTTFELWVQLTAKSRRPSHDGSGESSAQQGTS